MITENVINNRLDMKNKGVYSSKTDPKDIGTLASWTDCFMQVIVSFVQQLLKSLNCIFLRKMYLTNFASCKDTFS